MSSLGWGGPRRMCTGSARGVSQGFEAKSGRGSGERPLGSELLAGGRPVKAADLSPLLAQACLPRPQPRGCLSIPLPQEARGRGQSLPPRRRPPGLRGGQEPEWAQRLLCGPLLHAWRFSSSSRLLSAASHGFLWVERGPELAKVILPRAEELPGPVKPQDLTGTLGGLFRRRHAAVVVLPAWGSGGQETKRSEAEHRRCAAGRQP